MLHESTAAKSQTTGADIKSYTSAAKRGCEVALPIIPGRDVHTCAILGPGSNRSFCAQMGGVWERQIRTVRKILASIIGNQVLDDEHLEIFFCEAESVINGRPLILVCGDPTDLEALTPNHLLMLRGVSSVLTRDAVNEDQYGRRWRHVQFMADQIWKRSVNEYMKTLQMRQNGYLDCDISCLMMWFLLPMR